MDRCVKIEHARFFGGLNLVGMNTGRDLVTATDRVAESPRKAAQPPGHRSPKNEER